MNIEDIKARHEASQQSTDIPANEEFWQCLEDRGELLRMVELLLGAEEYAKEAMTSYRNELDAADERTKELGAAEERIKELEQENKRLFDAHSTEMIRADKLQKKLERLQLKFADTTDGTCPVCNHSLDADDSLWVCENCDWMESE